MGTERGGCSRLMKTPRHNGGAVHSRSMRAKEQIKEQIKEQARVSIQAKLKEKQKQVMEYEKKQDVHIRKKNMEL